MPLKKKDFIEIEFTGKVKDGDVFDSNIKKDLKKMHEDHNHKVEPKPFIFSLGEGMFLKGIDDFLIGKEIGEYDIELTPDKAFGERNKDLIQLIPSRVFREQRLNPVKGMMFNFDGRIAKLISVSGGRIIADFNNPLSGKIVEYKINVLRKVEDKNEKVKALIEFLFKKKLDFEIKDKKIILKVEKQLIQFAELFKDKFKDILDMDLEVKEMEIKAKAPEKENKEKKKDKASQ